MPGAASTPIKIKGNLYFHCSIRTELRSHFNGQKRLQVGTGTTDRKMRRDGSFRERNKSTLSSIKLSQM